MLNIYINATVYTMNDQNKVYDNAQLWVEDGKILRVTEDAELPSEANVIDLAGKLITPGLIDVHTHVGIWSEVADEINDACEYSDPFTPTLRAIDGINTNHFSFDLARQGGVTTVQTGAGSANPIGGIWTILKTAGETIEERILVEKSGLKGAFGENPKNMFGQVYGKEPYTRMGVAHIIRDGFKRAQSLKSDERTEQLETDGDLAPFIEVLEGRMPLHLHCHRADDIATAIRIAKEFNVKLHLQHATEGHLMLNAIKESGATVTLGPYMSPSPKYESKQGHPSNPSKYNDAGIKVAIMTDHPFIPIQYLNLCAAEAARQGMDKMEALRSITIQAAEQMEISDRVGSLEAGKDADFVIWSHHPFFEKANVLETYINGENVYTKEN